ncbi:BamA/TamA family outer membrane protein [Fluoribacter dumoffii]|uniref:autotransporter assembly complex protein TamA n=1 Tax=Fluoribacter dumoffii TaxID=463 RepID=UPI0022433BD6|nr:BamA/TamA family outer membrane protein [Fluoribacter dumoffii]MCW8418304.1 BamA/TamA family outer membrane protein [Fluoribacter dumoffii]MCW8453854.1 BamA/TamA family outer membrane protein [Fluoribacter dumoffii]MCW8462075.1 BamA/TamA family outer membrane protein [Fluoribacter dumoffii]MCW8482287.1 BamA/TamA family outer membrane protein [Fluoribacter dumoffii]
MKKIIYLILLITCFALFAKNNDSVSITVYGISGKVEANVEKRLDELQKIKPLAQFTLEELQEQVIQAVQPFGYFKAKAKLYRLNAQQLSVRIHPGPQIKISRINIEIMGEGSHNALLRKAIKNVPLTQGMPLFTEQYEQTKLKLLDTAETQGYLHARFTKSEILIDEENYTAEITLILETGPLYYFGQIQFNPTYIDPKLLHRFVPFHPGQVYSGDKILQLNNDLTNSGYFSSVLVKPQITDDPTVPIKIYTEPASKYSYTLGAGYGTDTGIRGRAALHVVPVNRQGHKFNLMAQGSFVQNALQAQYVIPGTDPVHDQYSLSGNFSNLNYSAGYSNSFLISLAQQHRVTDYQRTLSLNTLYEGFHYALQENTKQFLLYPKASLTFSKTQDLLFSPSGYNITLNALAANQILLSTINFAQASLDLKAAMRIEPIRLRLYGHAIQGFTAINDINQQPLSLALLLGGTDNLKAFSFNSIGPSRIISYAGFEIQKETKKNWYLIAFYDAGAIYNPSPLKSYYDAGGGLMWVSPIGPIKVGLAQAINGRWQRDSNGPRLVISMGPDL